MIAILDFGSQYTELIARRIRQLKIYCEVLPAEITLKAIKKKYHIQGIILSGGPNSVFEKESISCDQEIFFSEIPILGICYGMQLMAHTLG